MPWTAAGRRAAVVPPGISARLRGALDAIFDDLVEDFGGGVRIDSRNPADGGPGEREFQHRYGELLENAGARVESWEIDTDALVATYPWIAAQVPAQGFADRPVVMGWLPSTERARGTVAEVILNSHADTVGITDPETWLRPTHAGLVAGGEMHGLGSLDAKASLFTFLGVARTLRAAGIRLDRPVMVQSVVDEEVSGAGTLECIRRGCAAPVAIVGEPTDLAVCPGSRGKVTLHLSVTGRSAHPGEGWRGINAIGLAWRYVEALDRLRDRLDATRIHPLWAGLPAAHVWNLMALNSGPPGRAVPGRCEIVYGVGTIGAERIADMRGLVESELAEVTAADPFLRDHPPTIAWRGLSMEAAVTDASHPAVVAMMEAGRSLGREPILRAASVATDGRHLANVGGIPAINFGPGVTRAAHSPNERVALADVRIAIGWLAQFLVAFCGAARVRHGGAD